MANGMVKASTRWLAVVYSREYTLTTSCMARSWSRIPTAQGISFPLKTTFPPSTSITHLISSFRYEGAFENDGAHGHGIETNADGYRFFSPFKDSFTFHISCDLNLFF